MQTVLISKSVHIDAPADIVWKVLLDDEFLRIWYTEFSPGAHAETDWQQGSKVIFTDDTGAGLIGRVARNEPERLIDIEFTGILNNGQEDFESEEAVAMKGAHEIYRLSATDRHTHLSIETDMTENMAEMISDSWERALQRVKDLAENA